MLGQCPIFPDLADTEEAESEFEIPGVSAVENADTNAVEPIRPRHKVGRCELHLWVNWAAAAPRIADKIRLVPEEPAGKTEQRDIDFDQRYMERAVEQARKCASEDDRVHPKVGVVVVKDGEELATAFRGELSNGEHAEFTALEKKLANEMVAGATVYTTLEPCTTRNHPKLPCAVRLIERKVRRVVIGILDPNPKISGKGFRELRKANIAVDVFPPDLMSKIEEMNREFIRHHENAPEPAPLESGAHAARATLERPADPAKKAAAAEFLRLATGKWHLQFTGGGKPIPGEKCRIDAAGGYYLLDRQPGQLWCKIEDVHYDAVTREATFFKVKMRGKHWRRRETVVLLPDGRRMEGHDGRRRSLVYDRLVADGVRCSGDPVSARDRVFISYSHKDNKFLRELLTHLKPLKLAGCVTHWSDRQIQPGSKWFDEIKNALALSKVAILLVTKDFLASDFIHEHELGPLLKEAEQGEVRILWVLVRACSYKETPLKHYEAVIPPDKPLAEMKAERDRAWVRICEEIKKAVK